MGDLYENGVTLNDVRKIGKDKGSVLKIDNINLSSLKTFENCLSPMQGRAQGGKVLQNTLTKR